MPTLAKSETGTATPQPDLAPAPVRDRRRGLGGRRARLGAGRRRRAAPRRRAAKRSADVVVVGAGFAGLTAARELDARAFGRRLEARDRVGGRVLNAEIGGGEITERGGTFVGPTQDHISALAAK